VELALPPDYEARRRAALDRAIDAALGDAQSLAAGGRYDAAAERAERAAERWLPNGSQRARLAGARAAAHLAGARADTARGRFRAAYERAARVADYEGTAGDDAAQASALQAAALARGAVRVAVVPVWATEAARRALPDDALPALADELLEKPWTEPPRFVSLAPAPDVQRELRRLDLARRALSAQDAARLGGALDADYVVVAEVDSVHGAESNLKTTRRAAKTTNGADTAYTVEEGRRRVYARITYDLVDPETRRAVARQTVSATTSGDFKRARYAGDPRTLDLRRADRELFDRAAQDRDLARELAEDLSLQYARDLFETLLRRIP
jgi:hypothetical protein